MVTRYYSSVAAETTLTSSINNSATSIAVGSTVGLPALTPFTLALDYESATEELVEVTSVMGTNLTVTRGIDGTSATSHNVGARVRHVSSGRDFADSRAHENSVSAVHGVSSAIVGTTEVQTLTNKTLTSPAINSGSMTGTFTGPPTFSGSGVSFQRVGSTSPNIQSRVTGDAQDTFQVLANGTLAWGSGSAAQDVHLHRDVPDVLTLDDLLDITRAGGTDLALRTRRNTDVQSRCRITADGEISWGDGTVLPDTNLYRSGLNSLKTDDNFEVAGNLSVGGIGRELIAFKSADTARNSTTVRSIDPDLAVTLPANTTWIMDGYVKYSASTVADIAIGFNAPGDIASLSWSYVMPEPAATSEVSTVRTIETSNTGARSYGGAGSTTALAGSIQGTFAMGPSSGTVGISWAQAVSDPVNTTIYQNSWLRFRRIL